MQAVVLAAGKSSRFYPFRDLPHKSYVSLLGKKIIEYTLLELKKAGIEEVIIVVKSEKEKLDPDPDLGIKLSYVFLSEPTGMGDALLKAKNFIKDDFFLINAYHINFSKFSESLKKQKRNKDDLVLLLKEHLGSASQYGVVKTQGEKVLEIIEKPSETESGLRVVGMYLMPLKFLEVLSKTPVEHYSLEKAISAYAKVDSVVYYKTEEETFSLKYPWDLFTFTKYLLDSSNKFISDKAEISEKAVISGNVIIEDGVKIMEGACIKGLCYIGKNTIVGNNALVRDYSVVGENVILGAYSEIKNSVIMEGSKMHSGFVGDSVIGANCRIGANFCSANRRLDRAEIKVDGVNTGLSFLGVIMGSLVKCGIGVNTMPGVIIGRNSIIGPSTTVVKSIKENMRYYVKFAEVVEELHHEK